MMEGVPERQANQEKNEKEEKEYVSEESFNEQFSKVETFATEHGEITYTVIEPETKPGEGEHIPERTVVYIGGFAQEKESYIDEIHDLVKSGRRVIYTNPSKGFEGAEDERLEALKNEYHVPDSFIGKVAAIEALLDHLDYIDIDIVGHSQAGITAAALSTINPGLAKQIVIECPSGFQEGHTYGTVIKRFVTDKLSQKADVKKQTQESGSNEAAEKFNLIKESAKAGIRKDPIWRFTVEIPGMIGADIRPMLEELKKREDTEVILVNAENDQMLTTEEFEKGLEFDGGQTEAPYQYVDRWLMYSRKGAGHSAPAMERPGLLRQILNKGE